MIEEIVVFPNERLFIIGDLHGCYNLYKKWCETYNITSDDIVISVGDVIDRGLQSKECLHEFLFNKNRYMVRGNHEDFMINSNADEGVSQTWMVNGGLETLNSIGAGNIWQYILHLKKLPVYLRVKYGNLNIGICHAGIPTYITTYSMLKDNINRLSQQLVWDRNVIRSNTNIPVDWEDYTIHGHTVVDEPKILSNRVYINTGAVFYGKFSFIEVKNNSIEIKTFDNA